MSKKREISWPEHCIWPRPLETEFSIDIGPFLHEDHWDEEGDDLMAIRDYYDQMVDEGILDAEFTLNDEYLDEGWEPEVGLEYWDEAQNCFEQEMWEIDFGEYITTLKFDDASPVAAIEEQTGYEFVNENLLRQAFTRRSFQQQYHLSGCSEELELIGDSLLYVIVTREIVQQLTEYTRENTDAPFVSRYNEGDLTKLRNQFIGKEHLAARCRALGLHQFILYGSDEQETERSCEDLIEALLGAVAVDSGWDMEVLGSVADRLLNIQITNPARMLKKTYYEILNAWHQKKFHCMPEYRMLWSPRGYECILKFMVPENDQGIEQVQRISIERETRSQARETAAELAYHFIVAKGLWMQIREAKININLQDSINQLQELFQGHYVEKPEYTFKDNDVQWECICVCGDFAEFGYGNSKTEAKKLAAYKVLEGIYRAAGIEKT